MTARNTDTTAATEACTETGAEMTRDVAMAFKQELVTGQYKKTIIVVAERMGRCTRTIERHLSRARRWGLL
jgi:hypothetical protein